MICTTCYDSPLGKLTLAGKNNKLIGLWIEGQKHFFGNFKDKTKKNDDLAMASEVYIGISFIFLSSSR